MTDSLSAVTSPQWQSLNNYEVHLMARDLVENQSVPLQVLLQGTGLHVRDVWEAGRRITLEKEAALFEQIGKYNSDPLLGIRVGARLTLPFYGVLGTALMASLTLGEALQLLNRFAPLVSWASHSQLSLEQENGVSCRCLTVFPMGVSGASSAIEIDSTFASIQTLFSELAGGNVRFEAIDLVNNALGAARKAFREHFNCAVRFGQERDAALISNDTLRRILPHAQPENRELFHDMCQRATSDRTKERGLVAAVRNCLQLYNGEAPNVEDVAARFNRSSRTLRRQLKVAGVSFQTLVDDSRYQEARHYLSSTGLTTSSIANRLGYSDSRCFRTAFKRWSGLTPSEYRDRQQQESEPRQNVC
ncbi:MAG: AraC family transcriptional regulator ligand-binding domain-containing protein [Pseudomonadota bacterium]